MGKQFASGKSETFRDINADLEGSFDGGYSKGSLAGALQPQVKSDDSSTFGQVSGEGDSVFGHSPKIVSGEEAPLFQDDSLDGNVDLKSSEEKFNEEG